MTVIKTEMQAMRGDVKAERVDFRAELKEMGRQVGRLVTPVEETTAGVGRDRRGQSLCRRRPRRPRRRTPR